VSGDVASEYGSALEFRNQRAHDIVAEWLRRRVRYSDITSGIGSICSSSTYLERFDENPPKDDIPTASCSIPEKDKAVIPHTRVFTNTVKIERRNSC